MNKKFKIDYLSRDFPTIKNDLINYAKRYYSNDLIDFSQASINTFLVESVAYVGDILSFYTDYQANESFLATAVETNNIEKLAKSLGFKNIKTSTTTGFLTVYMLVPATNSGTPDYSRLPIINKGTKVSSVTGLKKYIFSEDIIIDENLIGSEYVVARTNEVGNPLFFAIKFKAPIISGEIKTETYNIFGFQRFLKVFLGDTTIAEILSVLDSDGNEYYEVNNLSQNIVYKSFLNQDSKDSSVKYFLKPISAQRRFIFDYESNIPYLMFGAKQYKPDEDLTINPIAEPSKFILNRYNNDYLADSYFDPNKLLNGDNFGIAPENTLLTITYRINSEFNNTADVGEITTIEDLKYKFDNNFEISDNTRTAILDSIQVINEEAIVGENSTLTPQELKNLSGMIFQSQGRAVTARDYETLCYMMPTKYGAIKRVKVEKDINSTSNNINLYVLCTNSQNFFIKSSSYIKENIKTWLSEYKMITDTVDILDAKIINLQIKFTILADPAYDKIALRDDVIRQLANYFSVKPQIGEPLNKLDIYREIRKFKGVLDIVDDIIITNITSDDYSATPFNVEENTTADNKIIIIPKNAVYEIKFSQDIIGNVI